MDFRRTKLSLALGIMAVGMIIALAWHGWQGLVLGRSYPYNTFLYLPNLRFSDLTFVIDAAKCPSPYEHFWAGYFPAAYLIFRSMGGLDSATAVYLLLSVSCLGLLSVLALVLRGLVFDPDRILYSEMSALVAAVILMLTSYPLLIAIDRCNVELFMALLISAALVCFQKKMFKLGLVCLLPPICFKAYPILLLGLFLRSRHLSWAILTGLLFLGATLGSFLSFAYPPAVNWGLWQKNLVDCKMFFLIHNGSLGGSASPWSTCKALVMTFFYATAGFPKGEVLVLSDSFVERLYALYGLAMLFLSLAAVVYAILVETEFFRRAIIFLFIMMVGVPYGSDYRLLYLDIAMVILILLRSRRKYDFPAVGLLALVMVPKREILLPYLGPSDSHVFDISVAIFINPACMFAAMFLLMRESWPARPWSHVRFELMRIVHAFSRLLKRRRTHV